MDRCDCLERIYNQLKEQYPEISKLPNDIELLRLREFATYDFTVKQRGRKPVKLLYSYCPHCGKKYPEGGSC